MIADQRREKGLEHRLCYWRAPAVRAGIVVCVLCVCACVFVLCVRVRACVRGLVLSLYAWPTLPMLLHLPWACAMDPRAGL